MGVPELHAAVGCERRQSAQVAIELDVPHLVVLLFPLVLRAASTVATCQAQPKRIVEVSTSLKCNFSLPSISLPHLQISNI